MPIPMPYYVEKGPFFSVLEDYLNRGSRARLVKTLRKLRRGDDWETFKVLSSTTLRNPNQRSAAAWAKHLNEHWFGKQPDGKGGWVQPAFNAVTHRQTGYWMGYYGDVDGITRATLIRTLEVALGVEHTTDANAPIKPTRRWHIDFLWKCSQTWFEGWVTWQRTGGGKRRGHVTVVFATPPVEGSVVLDSPLIGRNDPEFRVGPKDTRTGPPWSNGSVEAKCGMWVVTHAHNEGYVDVGITTSRGTATTWPSPLPGRVHASGDIVTVAPSMTDGGVLADGLKYKAP